MEEPERPEDVFQDEVVGIFPKLSDFRKFARSRHGLCLKEVEISHILQDNKDSVQEQKMQVLFHWASKKGSIDTVARIREIIETYRLRQLDEGEKIEKTVASDLQGRPSAVNEILPRAEETDAHAVEDMSELTGENQDTLELQAKAEDSRLLIQCDPSENRSQPPGCETREDLENGRYRERRRTLTDEFEVIELEGQSRLLIESSKFDEALKVLHRLLSLQGNGCRRLHTLVLVVECNIQCQNHHFAVKNAEKLVKLMASLCPQGGDVIKMGQKYEGGGKLLRAFILYYSACKLYLATTSGDEAAKGVTLGVRYIRDVSSALADRGRQKIIASHVIPSLLEVMEDLLHVKGCDSTLKIVERAWCMHHISFCFGFSGDHDKEEDWNQDAIDHMKEKLKDDADSYRVYGLCLHHAGMAYYCSKNHKLATKMWTAALSAFDNAKDWRNAQQKKKKIKRTTESLEWLSQKQGFQI